MKLKYLSSCRYLHYFTDDESVHQLFEKFKKDYKKQYTEEENQRRFDIFKANLHELNDLNKEQAGFSLYYISEQLDMTIEEKHC